MQISRWEPFGGLTSLRREMDRLFESFFDRDSRTAVTNGDWTPRFDLAEFKDSIVIRADLPGMDEKDISVSLSGDNLIVRGERKSEKDEKDKHYHRVECSYGMFQRIIPMPVTVEVGKVKAQYEKGVLELVLPKKAEAKPKEIPITAKKK
ncbi:MAG: Hsp20/alpha crystallin family protein [bacterium]